MTSPPLKDPNIYLCFTPSSTEYLVNPLCDVYGNLSDLYPLFLTLCEG